MKMYLRRHPRKPRERVARWKNKNLLNAAHRMETFVSAKGRATLRKAYGAIIGWAMRKCSTCEATMPKAFCTHGQCRSCRSAARLRLRSKHLGREMERERLTRKRQREELADSYVRRCLVNKSPGLRSQDIPIELVELERMKLKLHRLIKKTKTKA